jgi:hypothetical protein
MQPTKPIRLADCRVARTRSYTLGRSLVAAWHSTLPSSPAGFRVVCIVTAHSIAIAATTWEQSLSRNGDRPHTLELTRLAHSPHAPHNLGSWALSRMRLWIGTNVPDITRLISYQDAEAHDGALYKAYNWTFVYDKGRDPLDPFGD